MLSSNSSCSNNPITNYTDHEPTIQHMSNFPENEITSISKLEYPCSPFSFTFPNSPHMNIEFEDVYHQFIELFYQQQSSTLLTPIIDTNYNINQHQTTPPPPPTTTTTHLPNSNKNSNTHHVPFELVEEGRVAKAIMRKRWSKKDRHSKINTARGPRDRRMRLSLDVARKFFDLQDMLGYDKASRTVEWLLDNSSSAITEIANYSNNINHHGCSPVVAMVANSASSTNRDECHLAASSPTSKRKEELANQEAINKPKRGKKKMREGHRPSVERESRRKARERARERTSQKRRLTTTTTAQPKLLINAHRHHSVFTPNFKDLAIADVVQNLSSSQSNAVFSNYQGNALVSHQHQISEFQF